MTAQYSLCFVVIDAPQGRKVHDSTGAATFLPPSHVSPAAVAVEQLDSQSGLIQLRT